MKLKTQVVLGLLFLSSFLKSFKFESNGYDIVFVILVTIVYLAQEFITEQSTKKELVNLTKGFDERLNLQDEKIDRASNTASKTAMAVGFKR
jgi:hypothetical protein